MAGLVSPVARGSMAVCAVVFPKKEISNGTFECSGYAFDNV
ncbi:hypothetical protein ACS15_5660 [Ralstonia insidiosa]|uniref:Uncharacterized protein n=1 Tax=Ralstonia insidiosa TaxID=190721 RepID=A0AAC9BMG1_9RALS|nr:hypothetical protein ACS15_5660 [Ralstonia insidiosa]